MPSFSEQSWVSECVGIVDEGSDPGENDFTAFSTSRFIRVSREVLPATGMGAGAGSILGIALGAAFLVAALFLSSSKSLQRVVRISIVSPRSFFSVASLFISSLQASRSTLIFSLSNASGVSARVALPFLGCLALVAAAAAGIVVVGTAPAVAAGAVAERAAAEVAREGVAGGVEGVEAGGMLPDVPSVKSVGPDGMLTDGVEGVETDGMPTDGADSGLAGEEETVTVDVNKDGIGEFKERL